MIMIYDNLINKLMASIKHKILNFEKVLIQKIPETVTHFEGESGICSSLGSLTHIKPSTHFPQKKFVPGLKHVPHDSPSCFLPVSTAVKKRKFKMKGISLLGQILPLKLKMYRNTKKSYDLSLTICIR